MKTCKIFVKRKQRVLEIGSCICGMEKRNQYIERSIKKNSQKKQQNFFFASFSSRFYFCSFWRFLFFFCFFRVSLRSEIMFWDLRRCIAVPYFFFLLFYLLLDVFMLFLWVSGGKCRLRIWIVRLIMAINWCCTIKCTYMCYFEGIFTVAFALRGKFVSFCF